MLITTSRRTSQRTRIFCKELASVLPFCEYLIRGKKGIREILDYGFKNAHRSVIVIGTKDGNPSNISFFRPEAGLAPQDQFNVSIKIRKDMGIKKKVVPLQEDIQVGLKSDMTKGITERIASLFEAYGSCSEVYISLKNTTYGFTIDFVREDISPNPIGPQVRVKKSENDY